MSRAFIVILAHQILFQGMFVVKNVLLSRKLRVPVRGRNREASVSIAYFAVFILVSLLLSLQDEPFGTVGWFNVSGALSVALVLLAASLLVGGAALVGLRDSWRVGVIEGQHTELIDGGIYRYSRNPYFLSYLLMFAGYTVLLQSVVLLVLSLVGFALIHAMVRKEEDHLLDLHGDAYRQYRERVPRYWLR